MIDFGRQVCGDLELSSQREWLVTNGIGGYASGTVAGILTRRYHGLLIAALKPPLERTLLLTKLDETAIYCGHTYPLFANRWASDIVNPTGFHHLERFHLEGTTPVWTYAFADSLVEKRIWMQPAANTTYVNYRFKRGSDPIILTIKAVINYRGHHSSTFAGNWKMEIEKVSQGLRMTAFEGATPFYLLNGQTGIMPAHEWYKAFYLSLEAYRGLDASRELDAHEDHLYAGDTSVTLQPGQSFTLVASTEPDANLDGESAYAERQAYEEDMLSQSGGEDSPGWVRRLTLAADQFIVARPSQKDTNGKSIIAGYHWFGDWGRDTMIALPGLTLTTGRPEIARNILFTYAHYVDKGMLPNRFPEIGEEPEYNTVDATLWYFEALRAYVEHTRDRDTLRALFPTLKEIIAQHKRGTRYSIHVDPGDGLLYAGQPGVQLTWMDAKVDDWVVTPRIGKPVEINALWYNVLRVMASFAQILGEEDSYTPLADRVAGSFSRFWNREVDYCFDVIDGFQGDDPTLRPNQLLAVSLPNSPLNTDQQRAVVDACARHLLTSHGMRSLAPHHNEYQGHYGGGQRQRDGAYHQGTVWAWLIGPFVAAHLRVYQNPVVAYSFLEPLIRNLRGHGLGGISEIFDGDPPFNPRGCITQAWSVAEILRAWQLIEKFEEEDTKD